jgi:AcrR family transcriptional regulator
MTTLTPSNGSQARRRTRTEAVKRRGNRTTRIPEILDVAIRVFARHGDNGFTQRRIAADAGIQLGTLQHYFDNRDSLLKATIEESSRRYLAISHALVSDSILTPIERLEALVDHTFATFTDPETLVSPFALECWSLAEQHEWMREIMEKVSESYHALFSELVGQINPKLTVEESWVRAALIYSHWQGLLVFLRRSKFGHTHPMILKEPVKAQWVGLAQNMK